MKLTIKLAWRNLWRNKKRTLVTISSVLFAVLLAILFFSMEQGSYDRMIDTMVRYSTGYIQIQDVYYEDEPSIDNTLLFGEEIHTLLDKHQDAISHYVPRLQYFSLIASENTTRGGMVTGIEPEREVKFNDLREDMVAGDFLEKGDGGVLMAEGLSDIMNLGVGDTLVLLGQGFHGTTAAGKYPVKGIIDLKIPELNNNVIYMSLEAAQWFFGAENRLTALIIMPENPGQTQQLANLFTGELDSQWYNVLTWEELLEDLLTLMKFDIAGTMVLMMILYLVIAFGLFGTILMMMLERQKEFGLLFSLGMKRSLLARVCMLESLFISAIGVIAGIVLAIPVVTWFTYNPIPLTGDMAGAIEDFGFEPVLPFSSDPSVFYSQGLLVMALSVLIGLFPVYKVYRLKITDVKH